MFYNFNVQLPPLMSLLQNPFKHKSYPSVKKQRKTQRLCIIAHHEWNLHLYVYLYIYKNNLSKECGQITVLILFKRRFYGVLQRYLLKMEC